MSFEGLQNSWLADWPVFQDVRERQPLGTDAVLSCLSTGPWRPLPEPISSLLPCLGRAGPGRDGPGRDGSDPLPPVVTCPANTDHSRGRGRDT